MWPCDALSGTVTGMNTDTSPVEGAPQSEQATFFMLFSGAVLLMFASSATIWAFIGLMFASIGMLRLGYRYELNQSQVRAIRSLVPHTVVVVNLVLLLCAGGWLWWAEGRLAAGEAVSFQATAVFAAIVGMFLWSGWYRGRWKGVLARVLASPPSDVKEPL